MTYYDSLSGGDYITAFLEIICLPASLFPYTFPFLPPASKAKVAKHCSWKAVCPTSLFPETEGPCSAHGQVPPSTRSSQLWDWGESWAPKPFRETNSAPATCFPPSLGSPGQKLWYWIMRKLRCHFSYSGVFGSLSLFVWRLWYPTRMSSNCCPSLSEKGRCAAA